VPHPGVKGNERADSLAELTIVGNGQVIDRADILNAIRDARSEADSFSQSQYAEGLTGDEI
jgi:phage gp36-like protein